MVHLKDHPTTEDYSHLQKVVLCLLCVFNRKRAWETSRIRPADYRNCKMGMSGNIDEYGLSSFEKHLLKTHTRIETLGKHGRHVPIILTKLMQDGLDCPLEYRVSYVQESNPYLFALDTRYSRQLYQGK